VHTSDMALFSGLATLGTAGRQYRDVMALRWAGLATVTLLAVIHPNANALLACRILYKRCQASSGEGEKPDSGFQTAEVLRIGAIFVSNWLCWPQGPIFEFWAPFRQRVAVYPEHAARILLVAVPAS